MSRLDQLKCCRQLLRSFVAYAWRFPYILSYREVQSEKASTLKHAETGLPNASEICRVKQLKSHLGKHGVSCRLSSESMSWLHGPFPWRTTSYLGLLLSQLLLRFELGSYLM